MTNVQSSINGLGALGGLSGPAQAAPRSWRDDLSAMAVALAAQSRPAEISVSQDMRRIAGQLMHHADNDVRRAGAEILRHARRVKGLG
jgi:hypothetical protein